MDRLGAVLVELAELLDSCGEHDRAERLRAASDSLARADPSEEEALRSEVASWTRGMGSLTDLYLRPSPGASSSKLEANARLRLLTDELDRLARV